jgi:hypothetical protein
MFDIDLKNLRNEIDVRNINLLIENLLKSCELRATSKRMKIYNWCLFYLKSCYACLYVSCFLDLAEINS